MSFENIKKANLKVKNQEILDNGTVSKKKAGRPKKLGMKNMHVRLHVSEIAKIVEFSKKTGIPKSQIFSRALNSFFSEKEKKYKLVEVEN